MSTSSNLGLKLRHTPASEVRNSARAYNAPPDSNNPRQLSYDTPPPSGNSSSWTSTVPTGPVRNGKRLVSDGDGGYGNDNDKILFFGNSDDDSE